MSLCPVLEVHCVSLKSPPCPPYHPQTGWYPTWKRLHQLTKQPSSDGVRKDCYNIQICSGRHRCMSARLACIACLLPGYLSTEHVSCADPPQSCTRLSEVCATCLFSWAATSKLLATNLSQLERSSLRQCLVQLHLHPNLPASSMFIVAPI